MRKNEVDVEVKTRIKEFSLCVSYTVYEIYGTVNVLHACTCINANISEVWTALGVSSQVEVQIIFFLHAICFKKENRLKAKESAKNAHQQSELLDITKPTKTKFIHIFVGIYESTKREECMRWVLVHDSFFSPQWFHYLFGNFCAQ